MGGVKCSRLYGLFVYDGVLGGVGGNDGEFAKEANLRGL